MGTIPTRLALLPIVLAVVLAVVLPMLLLTPALTGPARAADPAAVRFADRPVTTAAGTFGYQVFVPAH